MSHGEKLYVDAWDHKPPAIYLLYWFADFFGNNNLFVAKTFSLFAAIGTLFFIKKLSEKFSNEKVSLIVSAIFTFFVGTIIFEGNIANAENFFMFFTTLGMYLYLNSKYTKDKIFSGISFSIAVLFKIHPLFDFIALLFFAIISEIRNKAKVKKIILDFLYLTIPFLLLQLLVFFVTSISIGSFSEYIFTNLTYNIGYTSYTESVKASSFLSFDSQVFKAGITILIFLGSALLYYRRVISEKLLLLILWFFAGLFAAFLSGRTYSHYALQIVPAVTLLLGLIIYQVIMSKKILIKILLLTLPLVFLFVSVIKFYPEVKSVKDISKAGIAFKYYTGFIGRVTGRLSEAEYNDLLDKKVNVNKKLSSFIKQTTSYSNSRTSLFLWGNDSWIYDELNADNPSRYVVDFHIGSELGRKSELMYDLENKLPEFIVQEKGTKLFDIDGSSLEPGQRSLKTFVQDEYNLIGINIGENFMVYKKTTSSL